jgi:hypothetical protein
MAFFVEESAKPEYNKTQAEAKPRQSLWVREYYIEISLSLSQSHEGSKINGN